MNWIVDNKEWLFSGVGISIFSLVCYRFMGDKGKTSSPDGNTITINNNQHSNSQLPESTNHTNKAQPTMTLDDYKNRTKIIFVDDDLKFKVSKILIRSGWVHTTLIKDVETLDQPDIADASILFIDVQGVGVALGFQDEGLGLALAIKDKYPKKHVIIYSAETKGDRFHKALRKADAFLPKNADPYEFQKIVEEYTIGCDEV